MKLAVYRKEARQFLGVIVDGGLVDATPWARAAGGSNNAGTGEYLSWDACLSQVIDDAASLQQYAVQQQHTCIDMETVELLPPLLQPGKILAIGTNYLDHALEVGRARKAAGSDPGLSVPRLLGIFPSSIAAPRSTLPTPASVDKLDFEAELAVVIGKPGKHIEEQRALEHVLGYMAANDFSAREYQFDINPPQTTRAKSMDGFTPLGPWLTTADEIPDPQDLAVQCWVNGELMQNGHTSQMEFGVAKLIARLSMQFSLRTGDLILTGTPAGCGAFQKPPRYLRPGDMVRTHVERLGELHTTIA